MTNNELESIKELFSMLGRKEALNLLENSNLNNRERELLYLRLVKGVSLKECAEHFMLECNSVSKWQQKVTTKLLKWIKNREKAVTFLNIMNIEPYTFNNKSTTNQY